MWSPLEYGRLSFCSNFSSGMKILIEKLQKGFVFSFEKIWQRNEPKMVPQMVPQNGTPKWYPKMVPQNGTPKGTPNLKMIFHTQNEIYLEHS